MMRKVSSFGLDRAREYKDMFQSISEDELRRVA
jgi:hypothetical protein